ncbi:MAG: CDP-alcohol phosphatidyltransferase family protein [Elusimicrobia bacterium]|nr:CDP-alcohol phosphatidyltransferase family protein [Candidatus Obscuribacterium magneticum]
MMKKLREKNESAAEPMTLANKITVLRIILVPIIVIALLKHYTAWVLALLIFSMLTDFLDGLAARWKGERTLLGAFLDPMADKLLLTSLFLTLTIINRIDVWVFVVVFSRDLLIVLGWTIIFILTDSSKIKPTLLGKITTAAQMCTALGYILPLPALVQITFLWIMVVLTISSAIEYIIIAEKRLGEWG